jgi:hypothetical protein
MLSVKFLGYETWYFALREERGQDVFENRALRYIFGSNTLARKLIPGDSQESRDINDKI